MQIIVYYNGVTEVHPSMNEWSTWYRLQYKKLRIHICMFNKNDKVYRKGSYKTTKSVCIHSSVTLLCVITFATHTYFCVYAYVYVAYWYLFMVRKPYLLGLRGTRQRTFHMILYSCQYPETHVPDHSWWCLSAYEGIHSIACTWRWDCVGWFRSCSWRNLQLDSNIFIMMGWRVFRFLIR